MILFDLKCARGHVFEGWFSSGDDFAAQKDAGLLTCPLCGTAEVSKAVMAPAVAAKGNQRPDIPGTEKAAPRPAAPGAPAVAAGDAAERTARLVQALAQAQGAALRNSEWVGRTFADRARAMHYGEEERRGIYGEVAPKEARDLIEEGVEVAPLLFPVVPPGAKN